jgi:Xaa-Pro aminopeptidase
MNTRINSCAQKLKTEKLSAILISNQENIFYLTGFTQPDGYLLITSQAEVFYFTSRLYENEAKKITFWKPIIATNGIFNTITDTIKTLKLPVIGFESRYQTWAEIERLRKTLSESAIDLLATTEFIETFRLIKTPQEIKHMKQAHSITLNAVEFAKEIASNDMTEKTLALEIEKFLKTQSDNQIAFPVIVATGPNSALCHHIPDDSKLIRNFFLTDLGAKSYGYCADLTRVCFWDKIPPSFRKVYDIVKTAQELAIKRVKEGVKAQDVDKAARDYIDKKGFGKYFSHGVGHGVGLNVHESPYLNRASQDTLGEGMVVTIEPGIYMPGRFGIRLEEMVLVKNKQGEVF